MRHILLMGLVFVLAACSSSREEVIEVNVDQPDMIDLMAEEARALGEEWNDVRSYQEIVYEQTEGSVELFPLDNLPRYEANMNVREPITQTVIEEPVVVSNSVAPAMATVFFEHASSRLDGGALNVIRDVARAHDGGMIEVVGHASVDSTIADPVARKISNLKVSVNRAIAVARALVGAGIAPDAVKVAGRGEAEAPQGIVSSNEARRVEIK